MTEAKPADDEEEEAAETDDEALDVTTLATPAVITGAPTTKKSWTDKINSC